MTIKPDPRIPSQHRHIARALQATPPPTSWWARQDLTWDQFTALARERAEILNAVTTTHAINRTGEDR
jgi:hypothetical protein